MRVYKADNTLLRTVTGETGAAWGYDLADALTDFAATSGDYPGYIMLRSMRDGLASFQQYRIDFILRTPYGLGYRLGASLGGIEPA